MVKEHGKASTHCRVKKLMLRGVGYREETWSQTLGLAKEKRGRRILEMSKVVYGIYFSAKSFPWLT